MIHVRHESVRPGSAFFLPGTDGARLHDAVAPAAGEAVVLKHYPNSFRDTNLQAVLTAGGVDALVICGMMTHMCIDATTRAAWDLGFACAVASDACATRDLTHDGVLVPAAQVQAAFLPPWPPSTPGSPPSRPCSRKTRPSPAPSPPADNHPSNT